MSYFWIIINNFISQFPSTAQKLHLDVQMGEHSIDHSIAKTKDSMEFLENSLSHLIDQMMYITKQQDHQRVNENYFYLSIYQVINQPKVK